MNIGQAERTVSIAQKMYDARRAILQIDGPEKFKKEMAEWRKYIEAAMQKHNCDETKATLEICKTLMAAGHDGMPIVLALAACVEMIEPLPETAL